MGKITGFVALVCLLSCTLRNQPAGSDRDIGHNVEPAKQEELQQDTDSRETTTRDHVVDTMESYLYVKELTGKNDGPEVEMFMASTGLDPKAGHPWCAAIITYVFKANGLEVPRNPARAASWFDQEHTIPNNQAIRGDLASLYSARQGRINHIMMYLEPYKNPTPYVVMGEGNTNAQGSNEGNRAAKNYRPRGIIHTSADWIGKDEHKT